MLVEQPLPGPAELQARTVDQQMHRLASWPWSRQLQGLGPAAQGRVVRHRQLKAEQTDDGPDQPLGLAQGQAKDGSQGQGRRDGQRRVDAMEAARGLAQSSLETTDGVPHAKAERLEQISRHL